jgi:predicted acylesterase/phospholipase RssA
MAFVGALEGLVERWGDEWLHEHVRGAAGCSGGCIVALAVVLGLSVKEMRRVVAEIDLGRLRGGMGVVGDVHRIVKRLGALMGEQLMLLVDRMIEEHTGVHAMTFAQLQGHTGRDLVIVASSLRQKCAIHFSARTTPDESVAAAIRASCAIPFVFDRVDTMDGDVLVDGALTDPLPVSCFDATPGVQALAFYLRVKPETRHWEKPKMGENLRSFATQVISLLVDPAGESAVAREAHRTMVIPVPDIGFAQMELESSDRDVLIRCGMTAARAWSNGAGSQRDDHIDTETVQLRKLLLDCLGFP